MDIQLPTQLAMMGAAKTQALAQIAIVRKQHEMEMSLIAMVDAAARNAPPAGQGTSVDKFA